MSNLDTFDQMSLVYLSIVLLVVLAGAVAARREPFGKTLRNALVWLCIFVVLVVAASFRDADGRWFGRLRGELDPAGGAVTADGALRFVAGEDGHFRVRARVDGVDVRFLVDTGASDIVLTRATATRIGLNPDTLRYDGVVSTANGMARSARAKVGVIDIGGIVRRDLAVSVGDSGLDINLLGMRYLNTLSGWRVEGRSLTMTP